MDIFANNPFARPSYCAWCGGGVCVCKSAICDWSFIFLLKLASDSFLSRVPAEGE